MYFEFVLLGLEVADRLLPVRSENVLVLTGETLMDLYCDMVSVPPMTGDTDDIHWPKGRCRAQREHSLGMLAATRVRSLK